MENVKQAFVDEDPTNYDNELTLEEFDNLMETRPDLKAQLSDEELKFDYEKIRELFADAEAEQQSEGDRSMPVWKSTGVSGARSHFSATTRP